MFDWRAAVGAAEQFALLALLGFVLLFGCVSKGRAQHDHAAGHDEYKNWISRDGLPCCSGTDCGRLPVSAERWQGDQLEINVEGQWCPVRPGMRLRVGKSPDWSTSHACVWHGSSPVCQRLKCYEPAGGF